MAGLLITLPIAAVIALAFLAFFLWSVRNEDYEDPEMIKYRMLMDEQDQADRSIQPRKGKEDHSSGIAGESQKDDGHDLTNSENPVARSVTGRSS
ncbi:MAG: cbb3-type cytochrome oxidase assembly protein CcoS [Leptospiraceae bacterium]|nr:cbb3-type cytochrome oxidase assembly protein CcoS [Leptospiraceae bacterium]